MIILAQNSKGGGLSSQFGGSSTSQIIGVKKTGDLLERLTWGFFIVLLALTLSSNLIVGKNASAVQEQGSSNIETAAEKKSLQQNFPVPVVPTDTTTSN
ncbi:MAG: preprotein translocase subunit SecG [Cyclobacteriaceae bacterium]